MVIGLVWPRTPESEPTKVDAQHRVSHRHDNKLREKQTQCHK